MRHRLRPTRRNTESFRQQLNLELSETQAILFSASSAGLSINRT